MCGASDVWCVKLVQKRLKYSNFIIVIIIIVVVVVVVVEIVHRFKTRLAKRTRQICYPLRTFPNISAVPNTAVHSEFSLDTNFLTNQAVYLQKLECPYTKNTYILPQLPAV